MFKHRFTKVLLSSFLMLLALWIATPKVYIHDLLHHNHSAIQVSAETKLQSQSTDDCDFNKYDKPVYFNIFKFIGNLLPLKPQNALQKIGNVLSLSQVCQSVFHLRGPPASE